MKIKLPIENSLAVQWLGLQESTAGGTVSISGRGTKIPSTKNHHKTNTKKSYFIGLSWEFIYLFILPPCMVCGILIPWPGIELVSLILQALSLNHWAAREILIVKI